MIFLEPRAGFEPALIIKLKSRKLFKKGSALSCVDNRIILITPQRTQPIMGMLRVNKNKTKDKAIHKTYNLGSSDV